MGCGNKISDTCGGKKSTATCVKYEGQIGTNSELIDCDCHTVEEILEDLYTQTDELFAAIDTSEFLGDECIEYPENPTLLQVLEVHDAALKELAEKTGLCDPDCPDCGNSSDDCSTNDCCPQEVTITIMQKDIGGLTSTPYPLLSPPSGFGVQLTEPPVLKVYPDGSNFTMTTSNFVNVMNTAGTLSTMAQFSSTAIPTAGAYSGILNNTYQVVINGPVSLSATSDIGGGGTNGSFEITLRYKLISY